MPLKTQVKNTPPVRDNKNSLAMIMVGLLVISSFVIGSLYQKVKYLEKGTTTVDSANQQQAAQTADDQAQPAEEKVEIEKIKEAFDKSLVKFGKADSKLILIEVADPSCPYCHVAAGKNSELNSQVGDRFKLVSEGGTYVAPVIEMKKLVDAGKAAFAWLYTNGHGNGEMGTKALYCAHEKEKFWQVHDLLMTNKGYTLLNETVKNDKTKVQALADFLSPAFNARDMKDCLESGKYDDRLQTDSGLASSIGVQGTPGFFINTTKFAGAYNYTDMKSAVDTALN